MDKKIAKKIPPIYGLALVGGLSQRMKKDKASICYHGKPQSQHMFELLSAVCEQVYLSSRRDQNRTGHLQIQDFKKYEGMGPLAGILSAMEQHPQVAWLVLACDLPLVTKRTLQHLCRYRNSKKIATAYKSFHDGLPEPLCAIYEPSAKRSILKFLKKKIYCPRKILIHSQPRLLKLKDTHSLDNANTPQDLKAIKKLIK